MKAIITVKTSRPLTQAELRNLIIAEANRLYPDYHFYSYYGRAVYLPAQNMYCQGCILIKPTKFNKNESKTKK